MSPFNIPAYIVVNLLLFSSWYFLLYKLFTVHSASHGSSPFTVIDRLIGTFILGLTQIIFTEMLLGVVFKRLYAMPLFLLNIGVSVVVLIVAVTNKSVIARSPLQADDEAISKGINTRVISPEQKDEIATPQKIRARNDKQKSQNSRFKKFLEQNISNNILHEFKDETIRFFNIIKGDTVLLCIFVLFFISVCWIIFLGYLFPSYTWDALWYHLPIVGYIMQSGAIQENVGPFLINLAINIFPKNMELFFLWNTIFLESDIIVDLSQLLFAIAGVFTIYSIAVKLKIRERYAIYSSLLFFFVPIIILQSTTNYVDIAVSVLFLIAINFLTPHLSLRVPKHRDEAIPKDKIPHGVCPERNNEILRGDAPQNDRIPILLSGLTAGILLGSKGSGPFYVVILSAVIIIREVIRRVRAKDCSFKENIMPYIVYFLLPTFLLGSYWYIKNWLLYGNPVYPMEVSLFGISVFKGLYSGIIDPIPQVIERLPSFLRPFYVWQERVEYYLYDSRLSGFGPIWFILFLPSIVFSLIYAIKNKKYNFLFISIIFISVFFIHLRNWNTRYVIFIVGLGALSFGLVQDYFDRAVLKILALLFAVYTFFTSISPCIMPSKIEEFVHLPARERTIAKHAPFNIDLQARQDYGYWIWISNNILKGDILAYTFEPLFLSPLWNRSFTNRIVYVKSNTYNEWLKDLRENNVTYILVRQNSVEDKWIARARELLAGFWWFGVTQERFKVVYSDKNYKVVRVIP